MRVFNKWFVRNLGGEFCEGCSQTHCFPLLQPRWLLLAYAALESCTFESCSILLLWCWNLIIPTTKIWHEISHAVLNCLYIFSFLESLSSSAGERRVRLPNHKKLPCKTSRCYNMTEREMYPVRSSVIFSTSLFTTSQQRPFVCWKDVQELLQVFISVTVWRSYFRDTSFFTPSGNIYFNFSFCFVHQSFQFISCSCVMTSLQHCCLPRGWNVSEK